MNKEAKELIQEGLKLFSSYNRDTLKMFYRSAKENEADLSHLDKKYQTYTRAKAKGMFFDLALGFLDAFASAGSPVMVIDNTKSERYNEKKLILRYKIKDFLEETNVDDNTGYLLSMIEFYCQ